MWEAALSCAPWPRGWPDHTTPTCDFPADAKLTPERKQTSTRGRHHEPPSSLTPASSRDTSAGPDPLTQPAHLRRRLRAHPHNNRCGAGRRSASVRNAALRSALASTVARWRGLRPREQHIGPQPPCPPCAACASGRAALTGGDAWGDRGYGHARRVRPPVCRQKRRGAQRQRYAWRMPDNREPGHISVLTLPAAASIASWPSEASGEEGN